MKKRKKSDIKLKLVIVNNKPEIHDQHGRKVAGLLNGKLDQTKPDRVTLNFTVKLKNKHNKIKTPLTCHWDTRYWFNHFPDEPAEFEFDLELNHGIVRY